MALGIGAFAETIDTIPMIHGRMPVKTMKYMERPIGQSLKRDYIWPLNFKRESLSLGLRPTHLPDKKISELDLSDFEE